MTCFLTKTKMLMSAIFLPLWNCFIFQIKELHQLYSLGKFYVHIFSQIAVMYEYHQRSGVWVEKKALPPENH